MTRLRGGISGVGMKRPKIVRDWSEARAKCDLEQGCRNCGAWPVEAAHILGREHDANYPVRLEENWVPFQVHPDRVLPLCRDCHQGPNGQHAKRLNVLRLLTQPEQVQAVADAGGIWPALVRLDPDFNPKSVSLTKGSA